MHSNLVCRNHPKLCKHSVNSCANPLLPTGPTEGGADNPAVSRFSTLLQFQTNSNASAEHHLQQPQQFTAMMQHLASSYPLMWSQLAVEYVSQCVLNWSCAILDQTIVICSLNTHANKCWCESPDLSSVVHAFFEHVMHDKKRLGYL